MNSRRDVSVLVTGGTGFVGRHLVPELVRSCRRVRLATREPTGVESCDVIPVGTIDGTTDWASRLRGVDVVIHLAAVAHRPVRMQRKERDVYLETNTKGTLRLAECAASAGVRHFIFLSSIAVNGTTTFGRRGWREEDAPQPDTPYAESKRRAEDGLRLIAQSSGMAVTIIRPPMVYGAGARGNFALLVRAINAGIPMPFKCATNRRAFVAVENLTSFILHQLDRPAADVDTFIVADDEQVGSAEFAYRLGRAMGRQALLVACPRVLVAGALKVIGRSELLDSVFAPLEVDASKAHGRGWRPVVTMDEGLARAVSSDQMQPVF